MIAHIKNDKEIKMVGERRGAERKLSPMAG